MVGRDQYGYIKGPYYMVKPGPMPPPENNKVESKKLHKLGRFPKLRAAGPAAGAAGKAFSQRWSGARRRAMGWRALVLVSSASGARVIILGSSGAWRGSTYGV